MAHLGLTISVPPLISAVVNEAVSWSAAEGPGSCSCCICNCVSAAVTVVVTASTGLAAQDTAVTLGTVAPNTALDIGTIMTRHPFVIVGHAAIIIRHPSVTTAAASGITIVGIAWTGATVIAAIVMIPVIPPPIIGKGWHLTLPVPLAPASVGGCPFVAMALAGDVVAATLPTSGGVDGEGGIRDDIRAAATTTALVKAITTPMISIPAPTTSLPPASSSHHHSDATAMVGDVTPALLPIMTMLSSGSNSGGGCGRSSEGPQGDRRYPVHSLPPPTVVADRAAWHGVGRPSAFVNSALTTMPPRPGPASLLSALLRPQPGRITQHGSRVGGPLRAARKASAGQSVASDKRGRACDRGVTVIAIQE